MVLRGYIACICEGNAEHAIMDLLLENDKLIFREGDLLDGKIIRCRDGKTFEQRYLRKGFSNTITILRILDSRREKFRLSKGYIDKIDVINIITAPEIEMLMICNEQKYNAFKKSGKKPSEYCKTDLGFSNVKSYDFVKNYFKDVDKLLMSIHEYRRLSNIPKGEYTLNDLLK